ncbi:MAG TPA: hypothetical protein VME43_15285 [Bryobacteraceae bacterium]|nr:hypothetical protein [Bryobacteraceae bacterium]
MLPLAEWQTLLAVEAGATATLAGLVFVAASINPSRIIGVPGLSSRVSESLFQFLQVFFISTAGLMPRQPAAAFAVEMLAVALLFRGMQAAGDIGYGRSRSGHP